MPMKWFVLLSMVMGSLIACNQKRDNIVERIKKDSEQQQKNIEKIIEENKRQKQEINELLENSTRGGAPATIYLSKELVRDTANNQVQPIEAIKLNLKGGLGKDGKPAPVDLQKSIQLDVSQAPAAAESPLENTYIVIGCENEIPAKEIAGLTQVKGKIFSETYFVNASKVFFCAKKAIAKQKLIMISTNDFIMSGANLELKDSTISMVIRTKVLSLNDANTIQHKARASEKSASAVSANIHILTEKLVGDGTLEIISEGAHYSAPAKPATPPAPPEKKDRPAEGKPAEK